MTSSHGESSGTLQGITMGELHEAARGAIALWRALDQPFGAIPGLLTAARSCAENVDGARGLRNHGWRGAGMCQDERAHRRKIIRG